MQELNVKVGDKLLYNYNQLEKLVTVTRVTPTGRIRIDFNDEQYDKYSHEMGICSGSSSLSIPTEEDYKRIKEHNAKRKALTIVGKLKMDNLSYGNALKIIEIFKDGDAQ